MPSYYNPYQMQMIYPNYQQPVSYGGVPQPMQQPVVQQSYASGPNCAMAWVDGEIEARGRQMPQGVTQFAMWDTNKQVIYLKSLNQMGMPNPMQILRYSIEEQQNNLPEGSGNSGAASGESKPDMSQYVTKDDLEQIRKEIRSMAQQNQNGSNSGQNGSGNRGGNR